MLMATSLRIVSHVPTAGVGVPGRGGGGVAGAAPCISAIGATKGTCGRSSFLPDFISREKDGFSFSSFRSPDSDSVLRGATLLVAGGATLLVAGGATLLVAGGATLLVAGGVNSELLPPPFRRPPIPARRRGCSLRR